MKPEVTVILLTVAFGVVHLFLPAAIWIMQNGLMAGMGPRDGAEPVEGNMGQRAARANANFHETLPFALALLLLVLVMGKANGTSAMGAWIYFGARVVYLPLYLFGVPVVRTLVWATSLVGLLMVAMPLFM